MEFINLTHSKKEMNKKAFLFWNVASGILWSAAFLLLGYFFGIIGNIVTSDQIVMADTRVANLLSVFRDPELVKIFLWITLLGKWQIIVSLTIVATLFFLLWKKKNYLLPLWITIAGSELFNFLGKLVFHRPRPEIAYYIEDSFSFPSGHATIAVAFYGFITYILFRNLKKWNNKINVLFAGLVIILGIGFSRLYLGVHFLSDVLGGYLLGLLWLIIGISILEWFQSAD